MRRADRLFQIVQFLRGGRLTTARMLAERLEVSDRTIYRDIADLVGSGVPIDGEAGVGYVMQSGFEVPPLMFTKDEITALVAGARIVRAWGGADMARAAEEALEKIRAVLPANIADHARGLEIDAIAAGGPDVATKVLLDVLQSAADDRIRQRISYEDNDGAITDRPVRPLGLWFWGKVWTLIAWCELRKDFRMFRVDRIRTAKPAGLFRPKPGQRLLDFYRRETPPDSRIR